jgi:hypothetical protein
MPLVKLMRADVYRDGGSIHLYYLKEDGSPVFAVLEVAGVPEHGAPRQFKHLYVTADVEALWGTSTIIAIGSEAERLLLADLDELIRLADPDANPNSYENLFDLRTEVPGRSG